MKRTIAFALAALTTGLLWAQDVTYKITGTASPGVRKVYVADPLQRYALVDSASVAADGHFTLEGKNQKDAALGLFVHGKTTVVLFVNDGTPIEADLTSGTIKGSDLNQRLNGYDREINRLTQQMETLIEQYNAAVQGGATETELQTLEETLQAKAAPIEEQLTAISRRAVDENRDNLIPAFFLSNVMYDLEGQELLDILADSNVYMSHPLAAKARRYRANVENKVALVGKKFVELTMPGTDGQQHSLSEWCGKGGYVLVDFWASWCGPCRAEMPNVKANYDKYHAKGFDVVGVSFDSKADAWKKAVDDLQLTWHHISDLQGWRCAAAEPYGISSIPASVLVDPDGVIVAYDLRGEKLGDYLKSVYGF